MYEKHEFDCERLQTEESEEFKKIQADISDRRCSNDNDIVYQALKLKMNITDKDPKGLKAKDLKRNITDKDPKGLKAKGLEAVQLNLRVERDNKPPEFKDSILKRMMSNNIEGTCNFLICVTMYDESYQQLEITLSGIADNLIKLKDNNGDPLKTLCIVIVDGLKAFAGVYNKQPSYFSNFFKLHDIQNENNIPKTDLSKISQADLENLKFEKNINELDEFAHCFIQEKHFKKSNTTLKLVFCVKEENKRKLNSHLWFFGGFCKMIKPEYVMLIDVGTEPQPKSLYYLYKAMSENEQIAGCCGEIIPMNSSFWKIAIPAQIVEYKFAHMLDKALESVIGYITVLPGAFSAYRWRALKGDTLWLDYFKSILKPEDMDAYCSNIYLAEDRVLCLSLVTKKKKIHENNENNENIREGGYILRYVRKSKAKTDVPETISELMAQRRRWINGSLFALIDTVYNYKKIYKSDHHPCRKFIFTLQMIYYILNLIYTWFLVGLFCLAFSITIFKSYNNKENENVGTILIVFYVSLLLTLFITSLTVKPKRVEDFFKAIAVVMGIYQVYIIYLTLSFMIAMDYSRYSQYVIISMGATGFLFAFIVFLNCEIITIAKGVLYYIFLIPTYVNIFSIYSVCNIHDCSWGSRPDQMTKEEKAKVEEFEKFRTIWVMRWVISNTASSYVAYWIYKMDNDISFWIIAGITAVGIGIILLRGIFGIIYLVCEYFNDKSDSINIKNKIDYNENQNRKKKIHWDDQVQRRNMGSPRIGNDLK